jgi:hypothetical protein
MRFAITFGILGAVLIGSTLRLMSSAHGMQWIVVALEGYCGVCLILLASLYALRHAGIPVEDTCGWVSAIAIVIRAILFPYSILAATTLYLSRWLSRENLMDSIATGLYVGRYPFRADASLLQRAGVDAVLDLCWELPHRSRNAGMLGAVSAYVPILDGCPPSERQFREATQLVGGWRVEGRTVLIHCAQGHGRSATVAAAVLCDLAIASNGPEAIAMIRAARPRARPSSEQAAGLLRFLSRYEKRAL